MRTVLAEVNASKDLEDAKKRMRELETLLTISKLKKTEPILPCVLRHLQQPDVVPKSLPPP